ncbi:MAG: hypothetical protein OXM55_00005, partial [Bdellovibrionales bacterium]|nr:hypothetical protein [Bdellovibrionales bacterium]
MTQICPCCKKELAPPPPPLSSSASTIEEDMGDLFSCKHCQSVLKWDKGGELKVIYESKEEVPSPSLEDPSSPLSSLSEKENLFSLEEQTPGGGGGGGGGGGWCGGGGGGGGGGG